MSDDLISRQTAIKNLAGIAKNCARSDQQKALMGRCIYMIENMPTVLPEQKTGQWEHDGGHFANRWICSQCGYKLYFEKSEAKYCPNCGAKMESDNDDNRRNKRSA